jgi:hypothetical protein
MSCRCTIINYRYRDASNYKYYGSFIVSGDIRKEDLLPYLFLDEYFVPHKVGLPHLLTESINEDDHSLHELDDFESTDSADAEMTAAELVDLFRKSSEVGWFSGQHAYPY